MTRFHHLGITVRDIEASYRVLSRHRRDAGVGPERRTRNTQS
jgi:hypothetical protein